MAWQLEEVVEHGFIDNSVEGYTTGKIWLKGRDEPLMLSLQGDCWRDLAGTILEFENPSPRSIPDISELDTEQNGLVGDMTASIKVAVPDLPAEEISETEWHSDELPIKWQNTLYLEWFSEINGRVLIETAEYQLKISHAHWVMDEDQEQAQKLANLSAMRDFIAQVIEPEGGEPRMDHAKSDADMGELDEYAWELRLQESERLSEAYQETIEKYMFDEQHEQKEAFVMGWDSLLAAMAKYEESEELDMDEEKELSEFWTNDQEEFFEEEWLQQNHPLQVKSQDLTLRCFELFGSDYEEDELVQDLISRLTQVSARLSWALMQNEHEEPPAPGLILAVLKRCLNWLNLSVGNCYQLIPSPAHAHHRAALQNLLSQIFVVREGITELRRELKRS